MKRGVLMLLTIAIPIMQLYAQQTEIGRAVYILDEDTPTAIFKRWYGGTENQKASPKLMEEHLHIVMD